MCVHVYVRACVRVAIVSSCMYMYFIQLLPESLPVEFLPMYDIIRSSRDVHISAMPHFSKWLLSV